MWYFAQSCIALFHTRRVLLLVAVMLISNHTESLTHSTHNESIKYKSFSKVFWDDYTLYFAAKFDTNSFSLIIIYFV